MNVMQPFADVFLEYVMQSNFYLFNQHNMFYTAFRFIAITWEFRWVLLKMEIVYYYSCNKIVKIMFIVLLLHKISL